MVGKFVGRDIETQAYELKELERELRRGRLDRRTARRVERVAGGRSRSAALGDD